MIWRWYLYRATVTLIESTMANNDGQSSGGIHNNGTLIASQWRPLLPLKCQRLARTLKQMARTLKQRANKKEG